MTPTTGQVLLYELRSRGATVAAINGRVRVEAPKGALTPELRKAIADHKPELLAALATGPTVSTFDPDTGTVAAVKLVNTVIGDVWLVADAEALADHPDIIRAGLPVFFFDEVEQLRGKTPAELKAIGMVKGIFPTGRVLQ